jgi:hypothetical protein
VIRRVSRVERHREQALLAAALDDAAQVEERACDPAVLDDADGAGLLDDIQRRRIAGRRRDVDGRVEAADDRLERERVRATARIGGGEQDPGGEERD